MKVANFTLEFPIAGITNQTGSNRIISDIVPLFVVGLVAAENVVEEALLPMRSGTTSIA